MPAGLTFEYPPWSEYPVDDYPVARNAQSIESFLMFNMFYAATDLALDHGEWPLWNPLEFGGMPLLANYQSAVLYPPRLLHAVLDRYVATTLYVILKLWLCGFCAFICARVFGLRPFSAMIPAVAWMLSGYNTTWAYWADPDVAAWLPLQLASAELLARGYLRRGWALMALSSTLMLLGGHPESAFTMSAGTGIFFFLRLAALKKRGWNPIAFAGLAWLVALAVTAPQTLPFLEYLPESQTFASRGDESALDLHFFPGAAWICLFVPRFFGTNIDGNFWTSIAENQNFLIMAYAGIVVWILAACAFFGRGRSKVGMLITLSIPSVLSVAIAMDAPFLGLIHGLPLLESIWGCWFLGFPMFVLALLAGFGWERIADKEISGRGAGVLVILCSAIALMCGASYVFNYPLLEAEDVFNYVTMQVVVASGFAILTATLLVWGAKRGAGPIVSITMIILLGADLVWAARDVHPSSPHRRILFETNLTNVLQQQSGRVYVAPADIDAGYAGIPTGLMQGYGIEQLWGYDGIMPARWWRFLAETDPSLREHMASVKYVLTAPDAEPKGLPLDGVGLHERPDALPRAFLSGSIMQVVDETAVFARMREPGFNPERDVITTAPVSLRHETQSSDLGITKLIARTSNRVVIDVETNESCALVLSDAYYPGWRVEIDGESAEIFPAYHAFRGVIIPTGPHRVEFKYEPEVFRTALWVALFAIAVSILVSGMIIARRRAA